MEQNTKANKIAMSSLIISIIFGGMTIYYQFFNENYLFKVNILPPELNRENRTLTVKSIYINDGNKYATIIDSKICCYLKADATVKDIKDFALKFSYTDSISYPIILKPGEQYLSVISKNVDISKSRLTKGRYRKEPKWGESFYIALEITYLNSQGKEIIDYTKLGSIGLTKDNFKKTGELKQLRK